MPEKTKAKVVIESHEQTIIRRSRRVISSQRLRPGPVAQAGEAASAAAGLACSHGRASSDATARLAEMERRRLGRGSG